MKPRQARLYLVSGLPASGKTVLARSIASGLGLPLFDKDDILEALFDAFGPDLEAAAPAVGQSASAPLQGRYTLAGRQRLSRAADQVLQALVPGTFDAVLVSFWRHPGHETASGTDTGWLERSGAELMEIHCRCPADVALQRFRRRVRHPGHCDEQRGPGDGMDFDAYAARGPLSLGTVISVDTRVPVDEEALLGALGAATAPARPGANEESAT